MLRGLRASDVTTIQRLCAGEKRLFLRLGALLQAQLACTESALEAALSSPAGRQLLNDRQLKDVTPAAFPALATANQAESIGLVLIDATTLGEPAWRVLALADEIDNPLLPESPAEEPAPVLTDLNELVATLTPTLRAPVEGLLQARADDERAAALEQLRYARPSLDLVSNLMPMLLADSAELVRERSIGLMVAAGAHVAVIDLVRALQRRDEAALVHVGESIANLPPAQGDLAVSALVACAGRGQVSPAMINLCTRLAGHLIGFRGLERLLELLVQTRISLLGLVRALQEHDHELVDAILRRQLGHTADTDATLIVLLAAPGRRGEDQLLERGVDLLLSSDEAPNERMALAGALRRLDQDQLPPRLAALIAARASAITSSRDTSVHWLIAECCRDGSVEAPVAELLAVQVRRMLRDAPGPHLVAALEQQLPVLIPASEATRTAMVEPLIELVARFRDERSRELIANCLLGIGSAATASLWQLLEEHPHQSVRLLATELLPGLIELASVDQREKAARRLLLGLARAEQGRERGALISAAARLASDAQVSAHLSLEVDAVLVGQGEWGIDALGRLASGPHLPPERRTAIVNDLLAQLAEDLPDTPMQQITDSATDSVTFVMDDRLGVHTQSVPRLLEALCRIGTSPSLGVDLLRHLVQHLCDQWRKVSTWQTIWGPGNIQELGRVMGLLAGRSDFPGPLRVQICDALMPRLNQLVIARSLARVFVSAEGPYLSELAGRASDRLVHLASNKYYADDEWPDLVETMVDFLIIPHLGARGETIRRQLVNLVSAYRAHCTSRARAKLRAQLPDLSEDLRARLDWA